MPGKLSNFWQDLKRRNVVRVITVYTGAAFVILSLVDMIREPFELPNWSFKLVIVLLSIGLIIAVILSWIYDIHPEGGIVKTEPANKVKPEDVPGSSNSWKIASYISFIVIVGLIVLNVIPRGGQRKNLDKSIAVLPLEYLSENPDKEYLANGVLDAITGNLSMIEGLRVMPRTSVEQYREIKKSAKEIGEELGVSYLIEGSFLMQDDHVKLIIQLVVAEEGGHLFFKEYDRDYTDIFAVQSEVAQTIAKEIEIVITPEEKQRIEKMPTTSLTAYDFYQKGRDEYIRFLLNLKDRDALNRAQDYYMRALGEDPEFAKACAGMAMTLYSKLTLQGKIDLIYYDGYMEENAFEAVLFWANKALQIDNQLPEAYYIRGNYYYQTGNWEKAEQDYNEAIRLNPNYWEAYYGIGYMYFSIDFIKTFQYFQKAKSLVRGPELSYILSLIIQSLTYTGNPEQMETFIADYTHLTQDSLYYYNSRVVAESFKGNVENVHHWLTREYAYDSTNPAVLYYLAESYTRLGNFEKGLEYYKQGEEINHMLGRISIFGLERIGYACWQAGYKEEADDYFDRQVEISKSLIRLHRPWAQIGLAQSELAAIYAFRGEKSKAMDILRELHQRSNLSYLVTMDLWTNQMLNGIRNDPEFQQIANDLGIKLQAEMNKFRQWLEDNKESL